MQSVVQELRGEKIDIVPWTPDQAEYVCRALSPAKVSKIIMDEDERAMEVIVPDDQLSLAIGKKGQNVRLASRLTGWRLDVKGEAEAEEEARNARQSLMAIPGIGRWTAEYIAMRALGEPDAFPSGDLVLRRAAGDCTARALEEKSAAWRPWRAYAVMLLWQGGAYEGSSGRRRAG